MGKAIWGTGELYQTGKEVCLLVGLLFFFLGISALPGWAQIPGLGDTSTASLPAGVERRGNLEVAEVYFDGYALFRIASPAVQDRNAPGEQVPVELRAQQITSNLRLLLETLLEKDRSETRTAPTPLETGNIRIAVETLNNLTALVARGGGISTPQVLVTVTQPDANLYARTPEALAEDWRDILTERLSEAVRQRRPQVQQQRLTLLTLVGIGVPVLHLVLAGISILLYRRQQSIEEQLKEQAEVKQAEAVQEAEVSDSQADPVAEAPLEPVVRAVPPEEASPATPPPGAARRSAPFAWIFSRQNQLHILVFLRWLIFWLIVAAWMAGVGYCLYLFPATRRFAITFTSAPLLIVLALFIAGLLNRIGSYFVDRFVYNWQRNRILDESELARDELRVLTVSSAIKGLKFALIYGIAIGWVLSKLALVSWSVLTVGAIVALAVSFAAQSLVKDLVMGFLILVEDQFAIQDYVRIGDTMGTVEHMNLRITQVRTMDGRLVTIPNNLISKVENLSRSWSLMDIQFEVPSDADVDLVLELTRRVARETAEDPEWQEAILNPDQWSGVLNISRTGITIQIAVQTLPLRHWAVGREIRRRLVNALSREGIRLDAPIALAVGEN